jgi:hypothetical protein
MAAPPTAAPFSVPNIRSMPPLKACTPLSLPPALTVWLPLLRMEAAIAVPPDKTLTAPPLRISRPALAWPAEMMRVWPPLTTTGVRICTPLPPALMSTPALA